MDIEHRFLNVTGDFNLDNDEIISVPCKKYARVDLCFKANMHIPFARIILYSKDRFVDAEECFASAKALGQEIERRWKLQAENKGLKKAFAPIADWYGGGTEGNRPLAEMLTLAVADLQDNRAELLKLQASNKAQAEEIERLKEEVVKWEAMTFEELDEMIASRPDWSKATDGKDNQG